MRIEGKTVLITGASEGIGAACANAFRSRGARLSLTARSEDKLRASGGPDAMITAGDITLPETRRRAVERTLERYGRIDILINNAGQGMYAPSWQAPIDEVRRLFDLNFFAVLGLIQEVVPRMREQKSGYIVNVGSVAGKVTLPWMTLYSTSKYALGSLTDGLRMELSRDGIRCMTVCPGYVGTGFQEHALGGRPPASMLRGRRFTISPERCAADIVRGVERDARTVVSPPLYWLFVGLARLFPSVVDGRMAGMNS